MKICILTIATNKYIQFVERLYDNIHDNFLNDHHIECLLFTEHDVETSDNVRVSPSTLRYMQNALDISYFFGEGDLNKIVEIGGGYGGLCKTINCLCEFGEYHIYDMEPASRLQEKYLSNFKIDGNVFHHSEPEELKDIDLLISNYAYSELGEKLQDLYYNNVIVNSKKVYMILNRGQVSREVFLKRAEKDFEVTVEKVLDFWPPNGHLYYTTLIKK